MRYILICLIFGFSYPAIGQDNELESYMENFAKREIFKHASISATAITLDSNRVVLDYDGDKALIPASSLKLVTTLSALELLGEDFKFETSIIAEGSIDQSGTLKGNLYIVGSGDPTLGSEKFKTVLPFKKLLKEIVVAVKEAGILCIDGDVIADESIFNSFPVCPTWQWNDLGNYYAAGAWGINVLDNEYKIYFGQQIQEGKIPLLINHEPKVPGLVLQNEVTTGKKGSGDNAYIFGGPYNYIKRIVGTIPPGNKTFRIKGSIPDPPIFFAYYLQNELAKNGIQSDNYSSIFRKKRLNQARTEIIKIESPPLKDIITIANFESNNLYCESILKTVGKLKHGEGSGGGGIASVRKNIRKKRVSLSGFQMEDGSGLSARNRVSSRFLSQFMNAMALSLGIEEVTKYIPKAGYQGTVRGLLTKSNARGKVWTKSGSMNGVQSLTGLINTKSGKWLSYSIIINGHTEENRKVRTHMEQLLNKLYNQY